MHNCFWQLCINHLFVKNYSFLAFFTREASVQSARPAAMASAIFLSPRMDIKCFRVSGALVCPIKVPPAMSRTGRVIGVRDAMSEGSSEVSLAESASSFSIDSGLSRNGRVGHLGSRLAE